MKTKKYRFAIALCVFVLASTLMFQILPTKANANSVAPTQNSVGSGVIFEKNDVVAVKSEVLDIEIGEKIATITAKYVMVNLTNQKQDIETMFISPILNGEKSEFELYQNGTRIEFTEKFYKISGDSKIDLNDWENAIIADEEIENPDYDQPLISAVSYVMSFEPNEEIESTVKYDYRLGGRKEWAHVEYLLTPAKYWNSFSDLTINLTLEKTRPVLEYSSVDFKKTGDLTYQAKLDTLPDDELTFRVKQAWFNDFVDTLTSPYTWTFGLVFIIPALLIIIAIVVIIVVVRKRKKNQ